MYKILSKDLKFSYYLNNYLKLYYNNLILKYNENFNNKDNIELKHYKLIDDIKNKQNNYIIIQKKLFNDIYMLLNKKKLLTELFSNYFNILNNFYYIQLSPLSISSSTINSSYPSKEIEEYLNHYFLLMNELNDINISIIKLENLKETLDKVIHYYYKATSPNSFDSSSKSSVVSSSSSKLNNNNRNNMKKLLYESHLTSYLNKFNELLEEKNLSYHFNNNTNLRLNNEINFFHNKLLSSLLHFSSFYNNNFNETFYFYQQLLLVNQNYNENHSYFSLSPLNSTNSSNNESTKSTSKKNNNNQNIFNFLSYQSHLKILNENSPTLSTKITEKLNDINFLDPNLPYKERDLILLKSFFLSSNRENSIHQVLNSLNSLTFSSVFSNKFNLYELLEKKKDEKISSSSSLFSMMNIKLYKLLNEYNIEENILPSLSNNSYHSPTILNNITLSDSSLKQSLTSPTNLSSSTNLFQYLYDISRYDLILALITSGLKIYKISQNISFYTNSFLSLSLIENKLKNLLESAQITSDQYIEALNRINIAKNSLFLNFNKIKLHEYDSFYSNSNLLTNSINISLISSNSSYLFNSYISFQQFLPLIQSNLLNSSKNLNSFLSLLNYSSHRIQYNFFINLLNNLVQDEKNNKNEMKLFINYLQVLTNNSSPNLSSSTSTPNYLIQMDKTNDSLLPLGYLSYINRDEDNNKTKNIIKSLIYYTFSSNNNSLNYFKLIELFYPIFITSNNKDSEDNEERLINDFNNIKNLLINNIDEILDNNLIYSSIYSNQNKKYIYNNDNLVINNDEFLFNILKQNNNYNKKGTEKDNQEISSNKENIVEYFKELKLILSSDLFYKLFISSYNCYKNNFN